MQGITCSIDWPGTMSFIKDLIVAVAAIVTASAAWLGVSKWRAEESGKADFDLARRLGRAIFRFRDAMASARRPLTGNSEFPDGKQPIAGSGANEASAYAHLFSGRFKLVQESALEVLALRNEAEALWDKEIVEKLRKLINQAVRLRVAMNAFVSDKRSFGASFKHNEDFGNVIEARVFDHGDSINDDGTDGEPNPFTVLIDDAIEEVAAYLRTKLPRRSSKRR